MSLMSDVTHQVKHPPTCIIHSHCTGGLMIYHRGASLDGRRPSSRGERTGCKPNPGFVPVKHGVIAITRHE